MSVTCSPDGGRFPHFIIAILRVEKGEKWILRATIDTKTFRSLVENVRIGQTGEVYLVNEEGVFQTTPRLGGQIMEKAPLLMEEIHEGTRVRTIEITPREREKTSTPQIVATAWLKEPRWMLVVKQDQKEVFREVNHAKYASLLFLHLCALTILIITVLTTRYFVKVID